MGDTKPVVKVVIKCSLEFSLLIGGLKFMTNMVEKTTILQKMPQSGVGSMQGKNIANMPSAVSASSINKSLAPLQYRCKVLHLFISGFNT